MNSTPACSSARRRGGRKRDTPNRRTIRRDRILSIGLDHPAASQRAFLLKLVKDRKLPADTRMAVAPKCFPPKPTRSFRTGRPPALAGSRTPLRRRLSPQGALRWRLRARKRPQWFRPSETGILGRSNALFGVVQDRSYRSAEGRRSASEGAFRCVQCNASQPGF
jgi:hypothetical protein